uniref:Leucine-rich repeat-containing protein 9 n=1 Tax=Schistosoma haematobium TaxID=6185 RepID=A0A095C8J7_SCHHA
MDLESLNILHEICFLNGIQSENLNQDEHFLNQKLFLLFNNFKKCISLQNFPFLTELYIISQNITKITKLETCPNLKKLWLCECFIEKIENLNSCKQLVQLYLYDNNIKKIENLTNNQQLEYLWLNNNQIYMIEGLNHLKLLKQLNLSGNLIINLNENLLSNQQLIEISLSDKAIRLLQNAIKKQENINTMYDHSISINRIDQLNKKINYWENIHDKYQCKYNLLCNRLKEHLHFRQHIYDLELQMFGYIEIKEINNNDHLFIDCNEFLNSRFCYHHMNGSIINGIKILHLYKINNRIFNENDNNNKSSTKKLKSSINNQSIKYSTFSDYLFIVCPEKIDELKLYMNIIRNGLQINNQYKLTNNLNIADNKKLQVINQYYSEGNFNPYDHITRLLLMKVSKFTHPNLSNNNNNNNNHNDNQEDQLYVENILFYENQSNCYCFSQIKKPDLLQNKLLYPEYIVELEYILKNNQSNSILDPFNIETNFEFNTHFDKFDEEIKMDQNFIKTISVLSSSSIEDHNHLDHLNEILNNDDELLHNSMNFYLDQTHLLIINTKITKKLQFFDFSNLTYISITHCQLDNLSFIPCNNNNNLMTLIINHNQLNSLESLGYMPNLIELQVDYNQLTCIIENVSILLLNTPKLEKLSWRYNPWINDKFIKMYTLYKLPTIKLFNFQLINNDDIQLANELFNSSIITSNMIENVYKNDIQCNNNDFDQNLTIFPIAYYHHYNQYFYNNTIQSMNKLNYFHLITSLCLQSLNLYKIENLTHLTNLKYLSLNYNFIKKIEGLTHCNNLIELSVEYNLIESIDNIDHLIKLQSLLLSNNKIKKINKLQFKSLLNLSKLNLNNNQIDNIDEKNYLKSFGGLLFFKNLQMICLNDNNIESLFSNYIYTLAINDHHHHHNQKINPIELHFINLYKSKQPIYPYLNVLHLAHNNIHSLKELQFHRMSNLQTLFLQNNELITLNGIEGLNQLKELVLDNNKIKFINDLTFLYNWTLSEIHLENNLLNELNQLSKLENLKRLYVGANKLTNFIDLENFAKNQPNLYEISLIDNPITTRQIHRLILIYYIPKLQIIDGIQITIEERDRILDFYKELELSNIINCGMIQSSNWYHQSIGKINNPICEMTLPEIINKKSLISSITMNDHIDLSNHSKEENQTIFVYGKQIHQHININNNCPLNKTKLNMKHHSIQSDMNEKNALTIKSIHNHSKNSFVGNLIHYQHQYIKQKDQCSMPEINKLSINSITRPLSQTNKVNQLKSLKHNKNNDNNNNNCYIKTTKNITIHADSNSNRSGNSNNNLIKFSAMSTNFQR